VEPGLTPALGQPDKRLLDRLIADRQQVGHLVDSDDDARAWRRVFPVAALHLADQVFKQRRCVLRCCGDRRDQVGQTIQRRQPPAFGVDQRQLEVGLPVKQRQRQEQAAQKLGLAAPVAPRSGHA
jgi:hypothetical protein